ncbi:MAG TPA: dynamin family protein [Puia sp.]|nr:dynamin family protein [Puia sp.]
MSSQSRYLLEQLRELAADTADEAFFSELDNLEDKLRQGKVNLVVLGLFKRGKSSLVNSILGCTLAPVGVTPLTAIVTSFEHHPDRSFAQVYFQDGRITEVPVSDITRFVSEDENPGNEKNVTGVRLFDCVLPVLKTLTLIDTPGIGSAYAHNTATTVEFIPRVDAALFVLSADLPISQADIDFLKTLKDSVPTILFVLNKTDLLAESDLRQLIAHDKKILVNQVGLDPATINILPVSARQYQSGAHGMSGIEPLMQHIRFILEAGNGSLFQQTLARRTDRLIRQLQHLFELRLEALRVPAVELEDKQRRLRGIPVMLHAQKGDFESILRGQTQRLTQEIRESLQEAADQLRKDLPDQITELAARPPDQVQKSRQLAQRIADRLEERRLTLETTVKEHFDAMLREQARQPGSFLHAVTEQLSTVMRIDFEIIAEKFDLDVYAPLYQSFDGGNLPVKDPFFFRLLSASARARRRGERLLAWFQEIILRNSAACMYNLDYRIQESARKFSFALNKRVIDLVEELDTLLEEARTLHSHYQETLDERVGEMQHKLDRLAALRNPRPASTEHPGIPPI